MEIFECQPVQAKAAFHLNVREFFVCVFGEAESR
jgi:hypothetical protein